MPEFKFPKLELNQWKDTRDCIQIISKIMGAVRISFTQKQKHWYHVNVRPSIRGFSTTTIHEHHNTIFELEFDLHQHQLKIIDYKGTEFGISPMDHTVAGFAKETSNSVIKICGVKPDISDEILNNNSKLIYHEEYAGKYLLAFSQISIVFKAFKHSLKDETSEVQLWPDHFDLALLWFTGNKIAGKDPNNEEESDEQMNFGFSTGDESIPEPYIYITAYPRPTNMNEIKVQSPLYWYDKTFNGFVLPYHEMIKTEDPAQFLYETLVRIQKQVSTLMSSSS